MRYTENINLPIVEGNDKYSKEINNLAFETIDREINLINEKVKTLDTPDVSLLEIIDKVEGFEDKVDDVKSKLDDIEDRVNSGTGGNIDTSTIQNMLTSYQKKTDTTLTTKQKTVVGAINELLSDINVIKEDLENSSTPTTPVITTINRTVKITDEDSKKYEEIITLGDNFTNYTNSNYPYRYKSLRAIVDDNICTIQGIINMTTKYDYSKPTVTSETWHYQIVKDRYLSGELTPASGTATINSIAYSSDWKKLAPSLVVVRDDGSFLVDRETMEINPDCIKYIVINFNYNLGKSMIADKYKTYVESRKKTIGKHKGSKFTLVTDTHFSVVDLRSETNDKQGVADFAHPRIINNIANSTNSLFTVLCGDVISENRSMTKANCLNSFKYMRKMLNENTMFVIGNHDICYALGTTSDKYCSVKEINEQLTVGKTQLVNNPSDAENMYYYYDDHDNKVRYIVLNSMDLPSGVVGNIPAFLPKQIQWLNSVALQTDYDVVCFSHHSLLDKDMLYPKPNSSEPKVKNVDVVKKVLENFANGISGTITGTDTGNYACSVTTNFTKQGKVIHIFGHYHIDYKNKVNGVTHICVDSAYPYAKETQYLPTDGKGSDYDRTGNNELCISLVTIDTENKILYLERVGAGSDYYINY